MRTIRGQGQGAWLFRLSVSGTNEQEPFPLDLRQRITTFWSMLESLARSDAAKNWNDVSAPDAIPEEILCILAVKTLAANERNSFYPSIDALLLSLPDTPEEFLGEGGRATRELTRIFSIYGKRPDSLKFRILSLLVLQGDPVEIYGDMWRRTLALRELAEHWQAGERDDGRMDAKDSLAMILAIGLCALDYYVDPRIVVPAKAAREPIQFSKLFKLLYDALREIRAIELFNQTFWSELFKHLLVRRALYENAEPKESPFLASLTQDSEPTLPEMLGDIANVSELFFDGLAALERNGVSGERIIAAIELADIDLAGLLGAAQRLNTIDDRRSYRVETAERLLGEMGHRSTVAVD